MPNNISFSTADNSLHFVQATREKLGISRQAFAARLDPPVCATTVYNWERGERCVSITYLKKICSILGITPDAALGAIVARPSRSKSQVA